MRTGNFRKVQFTMTMTGYGQYRIEADYKGKHVSVHETDSEVWDWIEDDGRPEKQAWALKHCYNAIAQAYEDSYAPQMKVKRTYEGAWTANNNTVSGAYHDSNRTRLISDMRRMAMGNAFQPEGQCAWQVRCEATGYEYLATHRWGKTRVTETYR